MFQGIIQQLGHVNSFFLNEETCVSFPLTEFFKESSKQPQDKRNYIPEMIQTIILELPEDAIEKVRSWF